MFLSEDKPSPEMPLKLQPKGNTMTLFRNVKPEPHPRYREIAEACREMGMEVRDDDYEFIDE